MPGWLAAPSPEAYGAQSRSPCALYPLSGQSGLLRCPLPSEVAQQPGFPGLSAQGGEHTHVAGCRGGRGGRRAR
eukprot:1528948-Lingulodinium_polyedra.AAC.1